MNPGTSTCLKPCSGLIVTGFTKSKMNEGLENILPMKEAYNDYKKVTQAPSAFKGTIYV